MFEHSTFPNVTIGFIQFSALFPLPQASPWLQKVVRVLQDLWNFIGSKFHDLFAYFSESVCVDIGVLSQLGRVN